MLLKPALHRRIFLSGLLITIIGLPTSKFLMSVGQLILLGNWFLEGGLSTKFKTFFANKTAVILASVYLLHLLGLLWTEDFGYAFNDLRIKLPLLWLPLVLSSSPPVSRRQLDKMLWVFIGASLVSSLVSTMIYSGCMQAIGLFKDGRISPFISHIRLSLLMVLAYLVLLRFSFRKTVNIKLKITTFILALWFAVFLFILGAMTGIFIFFLVTFLLLCYFVFSPGVKPIKRLAIASVFLLMCLAMSMYVYRTVSAFLSVKDDLSALDAKTLNGEPYRHNIKNREVENGHYVWIYMAEKELSTEWNKRSAISYDSTDRKGQPLYATIARYLTSKGLRKDSAGLASLSDAEMHAIENGVANADFPGMNPFEKRIIQITEEINKYRLDHNPGGNSVAQRFEFWKTAFRIIRRHPILGVGSGDVQWAFDRQYAEDRSQLLQKYRLRAHNQYITMAVAFGLPGLLWFLFAFIYPLTRRENRNYLFLSWFMVAALSMVNEDTLETQAGATFFAFFISLFLFGRGETGADSSM